MSSTIPSAEEVRRQLCRLSMAQLEALAGLSGVPLSTIHKIRYGASLNPGLETVRGFLPFISAVENTAPPHQVAA